MKEFRLHQSGLLVSRDGEIYVPQSGSRTAHYTYGSKRKRDGYMEVQYQNKPYLVHRLVAECYIPNPDGKEEVDHIIPVSMGGTNDVSNLRWCTRLENQNNDLTKQKMSESQKENTNCPKKPVVGVNKTTGEIVEFDSITDAWLTLNIKKGHICSCCKGKLKSAGGYVWNYA